MSMIARLAKTRRADQSAGALILPMQMKKRFLRGPLFLLVLAFSAAFSVANAQSTLRGSVGILEVEAGTEPMQSFVLSTLGEDAHPPTAEGLTEDSLMAVAKQMVFSIGTSGGRPPLPVLAILADPRGVAERSPSKDILYPLCGWAQPIFESEQYCAWVLATERLSDAYGTFFRRSIVTSPSIYVNEKEPWQGNVPLPTPLTALGDYLPSRVPLEVIEAERHTYYWYLRLIVNAYSYVRRCVAANVREVHPPPFVPHGYSGQRLYYTDEEREEGNPAIGQSFYKEDHLIFTMRGTVFRGGTVVDLSFADMPRNITDPFGLKGQVSQGFFSQTPDLVRDLEEAIDYQPGITRVTLAGHSLGGALAKLVGTMLKLRRPELDVEVLTVGAPTVGDKEFCAFYDTLGIRSRDLMYLGNGLKTSGSTPYGVGDIIVQSPAFCWPAHGCVGAQFSDPTVLIRRGVTGGQVPFYAEDMPNTAKWHEKEQVVTRSSSATACHSCSYLCWASQGTGDPEDRCYWKTQGDFAFPCVYGD